MTLQNKNALIFLAFATVFFVLPPGASAQTWQQSFSDYNDLWCPVTDIDKTYTGMPSCPSADPTGQSCTSGSICRVNAVQDSGTGCGIQTEIYRCSSPLCEYTETSPGSCTQTGSQWSTYANATYSGNLVQTWPAQPTSCLDNCKAAAGAKYCTQKTYEYDLLSQRNYTCWAYAATPSPVYTSSPQQSTFQGGERDTRTTFISAAYGPTYSCTPPTYSSSCTTQPAPTASLTANPISVVQGSSSTLTWSSTNATSCTIDNGVGAVTPNTTGTSGVTPSANTTYTLTCTGAGGTATASATVAVTPPAMNASCSVSPTSIDAGGSATWTATASGGTGSYTYSWSGTDSLAGTGSSLARTYTTAGVKTASVTVTSGSLSSTVQCSNSLSVRPPPPTGLSHMCAADGTSVTLSWNPVSGADNYYVRLFDNVSNYNGVTGYAGYTDGYTGTSITYAVVPGRSNDWWIHSNIGAANYDSTHYSAPAHGTGFTCNAAQNPVLSCSVNPSSTTVGGSATYTASGASPPHTWTPSDGVGSYGTGSTANRTFTANGSYGMTVSKSGYTSGNCPVVTVGVPSCGTANAQISANPDRVRADNNNGTLLTWSASGVDASCTITGPGVNQTVVPTACSVPSGSLQTPQITAQSTYRINCDSGESIREAIVNLIPKFIEF